MKQLLNRTILLLEDDKSYAKMLILDLKEMGIKEVYHATNYKEALNLYAGQKIDLLIVDIHLGKESLSGDVFIRKIRRKKDDVAVLYLTSFFNETTYEKVKDTNPISFLDKELSKLELRQAVELALNRVGTISTRAQMDLFSSKSFFFKIGHLYKSVRPDEILYFFAKEKSTYAKIEGRNFPISPSLKTLEEELISKGFVRIHKSYLVNTEHIKQLDLRENEIQIGDESLPIGKLYRKSFLDRLRLLR